MTDQDDLLIAGGTGQARDLLIAALPELANSDRYRCLDQDDRRSVYLVLAAFSGFLQDAIVAGEDDRGIERAYDVLEQLCALHDQELDAILMVEFFGHVEPMLELLVASRFHSRTRSLWDRWKAA